MIMNVDRIQKNTKLLEESAKIQNSISELQKQRNNSAVNAERQKLLGILKPGIALYSTEDITKWISEINQESIMFAEMFGIYLSLTDLTTSQIRNVFGAVKKMQISETYEQTDFLMLKPRLFYAAQRKGTEGSKEFANKIKVAIDAVINAVDKKKAFDNFANFFEAILAYHRAAGGK